MDETGFSDLEIPFFVSFFINRKKAKISVTMNSHIHPPNPEFGYKMRVGVQKNENPIKCARVPAKSEVADPIALITSRRRLRRQRVRRFQRQRGRRAWWW